MSINEGGSAFPLSREQEQEGWFEKGMSLRDYFAGQVVAAVLAGAATIPVSHTSPTLTDIAEKSYLLADAMLKARG